MAGHAQLEFVMTECSKTQIRLTGLIYLYMIADSYCLQLYNFYMFPHIVVYPLYDCISNSMQKSELQGLVLFNFKIKFLFKPLLFLL